MVKTNISTTMRALGRNTMKSTIMVVLQKGNDVLSFNVR